MISQHNNIKETFKNHVSSNIKNWWIRNNLVEKVQIEIESKTDVIYLYIYILTLYMLFMCDVPC